MARFFVFAFLGTAAAFFALSAAPSRAIASVLSDGYYTGAITTNTSDVVTLDVSLSFTDQVIPGDPNEILPFKKQMAGAFMLAGEGGPWSFTLITYDLETGEIEFAYSRQSILGTGTATDASGGISTVAPSLLFDGRVQADGSIAGKVVSGVRGILGTFRIVRNPHVDRLVPKESTVGHWKGTWTFPEGTTAPIQIYLDSTSFSTANPMDLELAYTPGRIGSADFDGLNIAFQQIVIDYFSSSIRMTYVNPQTGGGTLTLIGTIKGDEMDGVGSSSFKGETGTFKVRRVQ